MCFCWFFSDTSIQLAWHQNLAFPFGSLERLQDWEQLLPSRSSGCLKASEVEFSTEVTGAGLKLNYLFLTESKWLNILNRKGAYAHRLFIFAAYKAQFSCKLNKCIFASLSFMDWKTVTCYVAAEERVPDFMLSLQLGVLSSIRRSWVKNEYLRGGCVGKLPGRTGIKMTLFSHTLSLRTFSVVFSEWLCLRVCNV